MGAATGMGVRSMQAFWMGGAGSSAPVTGEVGMRGMLNFWMGGGGNGADAGTVLDYRITYGLRRGRR